MSSRSSSGSFGVGGHLDGVHHGLDLFAEVLVGHAEHGHVEHLGVHGEHVLGLLGVDVHAAGDDHVRLAVGEVEEAVLVDVADVAERAPALGMRDALVFSGSLWYSNSASALEVDGARLARGTSSPSSSTMWSVADEGLPHGALVGQPVLAVAVDEAVALGAGVVLVEHRAPPLDHLLLDRDGHGAAAWMAHSSDDTS
jgi:hypothetical protein